MSVTFRPGINRCDALLETVRVLHSLGIDEARLEARLLICAAADLAHVELISEPTTILTTHVIDRLEHFLARRCAGEPVSRILGTRGFWNCDLIVTPDVLDPRADTETLIVAALEFFEGRINEPLRIADLGTGSGALLCGLLKELPQATAVGVDISAAACRIATLNLKSCGLGARSSVVNGSWSCLIPAAFDLVVSNPPYIPTGDIPNLDREVREYDPFLALDGGADGLDCYREIMAVLPSILAPDGVAILEMGSDQADGLIELITASSLRFLGIKHDLGGNPRALSAARAHGLIDKS